MASTAPSRSRIRRHPERAQPLPEGFERALDEGIVAHVAFSQDGQPFVLPFTYLYADGKLYLHGAPASRTIRALATGTPVCVEVTVVDALIASKTAETHSVNYRSAICFGTGRVIRSHEQKCALMERLIARYFPGRTAGVDYLGITDREFKATELIEVTIEEMSAKARSGGPKGPNDDDPEALGNAGIVPLPDRPRSA
jgi:uncharacterized protein